MASFTEDGAARYAEEGYAVVEGFLTDAECDRLRSRCSEIISSEDFTQHPIVTFDTENNSQAVQEYFLTSGDKVRYFYEKGAVDKERKVTVPIHLALNKIGHALHVLDEDFKAITLDERVKNVARLLNMKKPAIVQSMYIFKQPSFGGSVLPHQDNTFLYTAPDSTVGFWIALEDADTENGCLWFVPKSHSCSPRKRMIRTMENGWLSTKIETTGGADGEREYGKEEYIPCPVRKGALVLIHGNVMHKSEQNCSNRSRNIYGFHMYDSGVSEWSPDNWLQPTADVPFTILY